MANKKTVERLQRTIEEREKEILEVRGDLADCQKAYQAVVDGKQTIAKALANDRDAEIKRQKELLDSRLIDLGKANQRIAEMELAYDLIRSVAVKILPLEERVRAFDGAIKKFCQTCHKLCRDCPIAEVRDVPTSGEICPICNNMCTVHRPCILGKKETWTHWSNCTTCHKESCPYSAHHKGDSSLIEKLAELEHEQWRSWVYPYMARSGIPMDIQSKWGMSLCPYSELPNEEKEKDRIWARKVQEVLRTHAITLKMTVREACRQRVPLDGAEAQAIEHALTCAERETLTLRNIVQDYRTNWDAHDKELIDLRAENAIWKEKYNEATTLGGKGLSELMARVTELEGAIAAHEYHNGLRAAEERDWQRWYDTHVKKTAPEPTSSQEKPADNPVKLRKQSLEGMSGPETTRPSEYNIECPQCHDQMLDGKCTACGLTVTEDIVIDDSCCGCHDKLHARVLTNSGWMCIPCFRRIIYCME